MRSHTQSVVIEPNRRRITGSISYKPLISDLSVLRFCNKTGGIIKGDKKNIVVVLGVLFLCIWKIFKLHTQYTGSCFSLV